MCRSLAIGLLLSCLMAVPTRADDEVDLEKRVQAAFLYNFARFTQWSRDNSGPFVFATVGDDSFQVALEEALLGKSVQGRAASLRHFSDASKISVCHVVLVTSSDRGHWDTVLERFGEEPVLTVGFGREFALAGGIIGFVSERQKVRFVINLGAAQRAGLQLSSQLLAVAEIVDPKEGKP